MWPRPRPRRLSLAVTLTAALALVVGGCAQAVDNQEHPEPPSATLPLRGPRQPEARFAHAQQRGPRSPHARQPGPGLPHTQQPGPGSPHARQPDPRSPDARQPAPRSLHTLEPSSGTFDAPALPPQAPGFEVGELPRRVADSEAAAPPVRLEVPAIGVAARVVRLGLGPGGAMQVPGDFGAVGWFAGGPCLAGSGRR